MATPSSSNNTSDQGKILDDDPCWGSPTQCDLKHLLSQIRKQESIRYETSNYVILDKPPDLRMDGPYRATVHKLLTYWYPPPSIADSENLLDTIAGIHLTNSLGDNELRHCHQLDYATSGVLCVARNREAANFAISQWEDRQVTKTYLAILDGKLCLNDDDDRTTKWPTISSQEMKTKIKQLEESYRAKKKQLQRQYSSNNSETTFLGYQPAPSLFQKYKGIASPKAASDSNDNNPKKKKRRKPSLLTDTEWEQVWEPVRDVVSDEEIVSKDWKTICKDWKDSFVKAAKIHNDVVRNQQLAAESTKMDASVLPTIFQVGNDPKSVYVYCPLAQLRDEFLMKVPSNILADYPHMESLVGSKGKLDFKPSLTKCTLIQASSYEDGKLVTKVKLWPITGRRHQLRVHTKLLGHPILGDKTYSISSNTNSEDMDATKRRDLPRMCLHSYSLHLNLLADGSDTKSDEVEVATEDPFLVNADGKLVLKVL